MVKRECEECKTVFEYEPPKNYPDKRKYCDACSYQKKAQWDAAHPKEEKTSPSGKIVNYPDPESFDAVKSQSSAPKREFKLTAGNVRSNALQSAVTFIASQGLKAMPEQAVKIALIFEEYIENGQK